MQIEESVGARKSHIKEFSNTFLRAFVFSRKTTFISLPRRRFFLSHRILFEGNKKLRNPEWLDTRNFSGFCTSKVVENLSLKVKFWRIRSDFQASCWPSESPGPPNSGYDSTSQFPFNQKFSFSSFLFILYSGSHLIRHHYNNKSEQWIAP